MEPQSVQRTSDKSQARSADKIEVQQFLEAFAEAIRNGNSNEIISFYSQDITAFDMMPPLQYTDLQSYKTEAWEKCFTDYFKFPLEYKYEQQKIHMGGDISYVSGLVYTKGETKKDGEKMECWLRSTIGLKKTNGKWAIVHEHNSTPFEMETGKALMNLKPGEKVH